MSKIIVDEKILCSAIFDANRVNYKMLKNTKEKAVFIAYFIFAAMFLFVEKTCGIIEDIFWIDIFNDYGEIGACLIIVGVFAVPFIVAGIIILITIMINRYAENVSSICELYLTETQICGVLKTIFGEKELRIPLEKLDNISLRNSVVDKIIGGKKLCILSNSGTVRFPYVQNSDEFMKTTFEQLEERKNKARNKTATESAKNEPVDELKKYKELLDSGIITQEEFDAKKKQILGL